LGNILIGLAQVIGIVLTGLMWIVIINALLSWVRPDPSNAIVQFFDRVSDLVCNPIRRVMPTVFGGLDIAPLVAVLVITFLQWAVVRNLRDWGASLGAGGL
jgi:YggT family protein